MIFTATGKNTNRDKIAESVKGFMEVFSSMSEFFSKTPKLDIDDLTNRFGRYQRKLLRETK